MGSKAFFSSILCFFFLATLATASPFLSNDIFDESGGPTGRALLQAKKACEIDFENKNYTILTSQCKGPKYPPTVCCDAFKKFACPFASQVSDLTTNCAEVMFSYINLYGKYPPGLFANQCKEANGQGLDCSQVPNVTATASSSAHVAASSPQSMLLITVAASSLALLFHLF